MNTLTTDATLCCRLSFCEQRTAKLETCVLTASKSDIVPVKLRLVQMLFFFAGSSFGIQSSPLSSIQVLTPVTWNSNRTHSLEWLTKS